jgi:hypothetical protein
MANRNIFQSDKTTIAYQELYWGQRKCSYDTDLVGINNHTHLKIFESLISIWMVVVKPCIVYQVEFVCIN